MFTNKTLTQDLPMLNHPGTAQTCLNTGCDPAAGLHDTLGHACSCELFQRGFYTDRQQERDMAILQSSIFDEWERTKRR